MAYRALYRTYRPQRFEDLAGQEHITKTLKNAIKENKIAHAYLFAGPRGTGKTTVAKIFAKAINCTSDSDNPPCNECDNCISITKGDHPDVIEIDAASNNGVNEVRDLIDKVKYAPINGKYKVYIIDEVHMMSSEAFNALLKTLEEPPAHIVFILATTEPHKILPTIISRCQRFDFQRVENQDIVGRLEYVLKEEDKKYSLDALRIIARLADGGMRDALSILEQCLAYNDEVSVEHVNDVYGLLSIEHKINFIKQLLSKNMLAVLHTLESMSQGSVDVKRLTFDLIDILKDIIIYKNTNDLDSLFVLHQEDIDELVPYILVEEAFEMIDQLVEASTHYGQDINGKTYFELAVLKICNQVKDENKIGQPVENIQPQKVVEEVKVKDVKEEIQPESLPEMTQEELPEEPVELPTQELEEMIDQNPQKEEEGPTLTSSPGDIDVDFNDILNIMVQAKRSILNDIQDKWPVLSRYRYNLNTAKFASMLCDGKPVVGSAGALIITFAHQPQVNEVNYSHNYHQLKKFLAEVMGEEFDFIAINETDWDDYRNQFIQMKKEEQLPEPKEIVLHHINEYKEETPELSEAKQTAVDLFGDIVSFEDE